MDSQGWLSPHFWAWWVQGARLRRTRRLRLRLRQRFRLRKDPRRLAVRAEARVEISRAVQEERAVCALTEPVGHTGRLRAARERAVPVAVDERVEARPVDTRRLEADRRHGAATSA